MRRRETRTGWVRQKENRSVIDRADARCEFRLPGWLGVAVEAHHLHAQGDGGPEDGPRRAACEACHQTMTNAERSVGGDSTKGAVTGARGVPDPTWI